MPPRSRPLVVSMGEPAGVGPELILNAWQQRAALDLPAFCCIGCLTHFEALIERLGLSVPLAPVDDVRVAWDIFSAALPVLDIPLPRPVTPGRPDPLNVSIVTGAIERAVDLTRRGEARALITCPIHKKILQEGGFPFPGHTEFLAHLAGGGPAVQPVMMLAIPSLKVVPVTVHLPLAQVSRNLSIEKIVSTGRNTARALQTDFAIAAPRLAVAALNPHAGEGGHLGREEIEIIAPAAAHLRAAGLDVQNPAPADTLFSPEARQSYDAVLCMYHDQALIPLKTIDFHRGVNVTLGLPFVRTSPDHGTAFDIAGRGVARIDSFTQALFLADTISRQRAAAS